MKQYSIKVSSRTSLPRSKRLRSLHTSTAFGTSTTSTTIVSSSDNTGHTHNNKLLLDSLQKDDSNYLYTIADNEDGEPITTKIKAGLADVAKHAGDAEQAVSADYADMAFELAEDSPTRQDFINREHDDNALGHITFKEGLTGNLKTAGAITGLLGNGVIVTNQFNNRGEVHTDAILVRDEMVVMKLVIEEVKSAGGVIIVSRAAGKVESVPIASYTDGIYTYQKVTLAAPSQFQPGDLVRCSRWDNTMNVLRSYWVEISKSEGYNLTLMFPNAEEGFSTTLASEGDELVLMGSKIKSRSGFILISVENGIEQVSVYHGVSLNSSTHLAKSLKARFGSLSDINDDEFPDINGYGLYASNAYLKGELRLSSGENVSDLSAKIDATQQDIDLSVRKEDLTIAGVSLSDAGITLTADKAKITSSSGQEIAMFELEDGAPVINSNMIKASSFVAKDDSGRKITSFNLHGDGIITHYYPGGEIVQYESGPAKIITDTGAEIMTVGRYYSPLGILMWWLGVAGMEFNTLPYYFDSIKLVPSDVNAPIYKAKALTEYSKEYFKLNVTDNAMMCPIHSLHTLSEHNGELYSAPDYVAHNRIADGTYYDEQYTRFVVAEGEIVDDAVGLRGAYEIVNGKIISASQIPVYDNNEILPE